MKVHGARCKGVFNFIHIGKGHTFADHALALHRRVIQPKHHVLRRHDDRRAVGGRQHVVRGHHQNARFQLRFQRQRYVHGHLVAVEVGVEGRTDQRVQLDRLAFDQDRLEGLDAKTVQRGRTVQQNRMLADDLVQDIPNLWAFLFDQFLGLLDGAGQPLRLKPRIDERLEQFQCHLLGQAALVQLQLRSGHDDRPARKVDPLAQKVLSEPALLALEHVGQRFQRALVGARDHAAPAAVVEQRIDRFLQHPLFIAHDDVGRAQLDQPLQAVVAVDHATVQVVQVRRGKTAAVQRDQRAQFRRNDRQNRQDHPLGAVAGFEEGFHDLQPLDDLLRLQFACRFLEVFAQLVCRRLKVDGGQHFTDGFRTDVGGEGICAVLVLRVEEFLFGHHLAFGQVGQTRLDHHIVFKVEDAFQIAQRHVQHQADPAGQRFQEPDMGNRGGQFDMSHPLAPHFLQRDFHAAFFADYAAILHALVFAAEAFVILDRPKDPRAEQAVTFRLERTVVDGFRLFDLAVGPRQDPLRRGQADLDLVEGLHGRNRVERVGREFLVHLQILEREQRRAEGLAERRFFCEISKLSQKIRRFSVTRLPPHPGVPC